MSDALSTEAGGFLLAIPGVADDFILFADGQWQTRPNGTARLSVYVQRASSIDRDFFIELLFSGRIDPGTAGYPPAGAPVTTMLPAAYAPIGPVDPQNFAYYTQVTGTMTGLRAYEGARIDVSNAGNVQIGMGANNKNVNSGLSADLTLTVVQAPAALNLAPTGVASLRIDFAQQLTSCATHVDSDPALRGNTDRLAFDLGGVADDYVFLPEGSLVEANDGTATLTAVFKRQSDYQDQWQLQLTLGQRVDPGDASYPPTGFPVQQLVPGAYTTLGGAIDTDQWRYYTQVTGVLTGTGDNAGGEVQLTATDGVQVGVGAGQGNVFFGLYGDLQASLSQQPTANNLTLTGSAHLHASLATNCILPEPNVLTGDAQTIETVTGTRLQFTGTDLGFVELGAIGPNIFGTDERDWLSGFVRIVDHDTLQVSIPQGLPGAVYPLRFLNRTRASNQLSITLQEPTALTMQTEPDRTIGEDQHWITHAGTPAVPSIALVCVSFSTAPSVASGIVSLQIGNQFQSLLVVGAAPQDPVSNVSVVTLPNVSPVLHGTTIYSQTALLGQPSFPLLPSNVTTTTY
tara:strand:- start:992 stop:2707 length:1716 start_codon:yes stop_codon:yes gene_type:complete